MIDAARVKGACDRAHDQRSADLRRWSGHSSTIVKEHLHLLVSNKNKYCIVGNFNSIYRSLIVLLPRH